MSADRPDAIASPEAGVPASGSGDSPAKPPDGRSNSRLALRIGVFYTLLAITNIIFFSIMIFENQTDLLQNNFRYHSESIVSEVPQELANLRLRRDSGADDGESFAQLKLSLAPFDIPAFVVFDRAGEIWYRHQADADSTADPAQLTEPQTVGPQLKARSEELLNQELVFRSRYSLVLNEEDFSVDLLLPLQGVGASGPEKIFLNASLSVNDMQSRLNALYYQVAIAVVWGVAFHALFAFLLYRWIFRRLNDLKAASLDMAAGDLGARAAFADQSDGQGRHGDELDDLGASFNTMAASIQEKVETISDQFTTIRRLNDTIQLEMRIGKEVQESFGNVSPSFAQFRPAVFYQPLREVSGDIYNFYQLTRRPEGPDFSGRHALFFADATGHGVSAALITAIVVLSLEELLRGAGLYESPALSDIGSTALFARPDRGLAPGDPEEFAARAMTDLNRILASRLNPFFHATALILFFEADGGLVFSNAGHTPCYAVRPATREVFELAAHGTPLGMVAEMEIGCERVATRPGDKLLIYSDGYTEAHAGSGGEEYSRERALELFQQSAHLPPDEILAALKADLFEHTRDFNDDVTMLVLEIPPAPSGPDENSRA